ncbi:MAG: hypothetical protein KAW12_12920 [Candidatus Aminicenantes bacterium]|nr:hypothetical protein [Candidatus Aminicenantes bacterium]
MKVNKRDELHPVRAKRSDPEVVKAREHFYANHPAYRRIFKAKLGYHDISQQDVADRFTMSKTMVARILRGDRFSYPVFLYLQSLPFPLPLPPRHLEVR